jgi:hypothetical protein
MRLKAQGSNPELLFSDSTLFFYCIPPNTRPGWRNSVADFFLIASIEIHEWERPCTRFGGRFKARLLSANPAPWK